MLICVMHKPQRQVTLADHEVFFYIYYIAVLEMEG